MPKDKDRKSSSSSDWNRNMHGGDRSNSSANRKSSRSSHSKNR
jgi:hypothetical protein